MSQPSRYASAQTRRTSAPIGIRRRWIRRHTGVLVAAGAAMLISRPARPESRPILTGAPAGLVIPLGLIQLRPASAP